MKPIDRAEVERRFRLGIDPVMTCAEDAPRVQAALKGAVAVAIVLLAEATEELRAHNQRLLLNEADYRRQLREAEARASERATRDALLAALRRCEQGLRDAAELLLDHDDAAAVVERADEARAAIRAAEGGEDAR